MTYPKFNVYDYQTPIVQWLDDDVAVVDIPVWRSQDDEFTDRKRFRSLAHAIQYVRKYLRVHHFLIHDGHRWHEIFREVA